jgi:uncharacterized protein (UPF0333 family)
MRGIFGFLALLIVLAAIGSIAKKQLQAVNGGIVTRNASAASQAPAIAADPGSNDGLTRSIPGGMAGAVAADPNGMTVSQQSRTMQEQARSNTVRALEEGVKRNQRADP